jgi:Helix-turn-helix of DDE superfamily endonuclease
VQTCAGPHDHAGMRPPTWVRAALSHPCFTGISQQHLADLIAELADPWTAQHRAALGRRRGHARRRAAGAGPHHRLALCDRVLVTLVVLRLQLPHQALATLFGVDRATITRAVGEVRPLLAARGFAVPGQPGVRLRTLANVFAYAQASGVELRLDGCDRCEDSSRTAAPRSSSRTRLRPERLAWLLRTGGRGTDRAAADRRVRRPRLGDLIPSWRARLEHAMDCPGATAPLHVPQSSNTSSTASGRAWRRHGGLAAWAVVEGVGASVSRCACWMSWPRRSTAFW